MILDLLGNDDIYLKMHKNFLHAFNFIRNSDADRFELGKKVIIQDYIFAVNNEYVTKDKENSYLEGHRKYIDIQYMMDGEEIIGYSPFKDQEVHEKYKRDNDLIFFKNPPETLLHLQKGMFAIFYPEDLHMPGIMVDTPKPVKKIVVKVKI